MIELKETEAAITYSRAAAIQLESVAKRFGEKQVIHPLNLQIFAGELLAIVGRSGCGKSTLLRLLAGLEASSEGSILINGRLLRGLNRSVRLMFQDAALLPWQTVFTNVSIAAPKDRNGRLVAEKALRSVGLESRMADWPSILSGGQRQRVALARALASQASILLLDEPLGALDALTRLEMQKLIEDIWMKEQFSMVLVTHDVEEAVALADRVLVMDDGRIVAENSVDLPRPRNRSSADFISLKEELLSWVMTRR
jgi:sulfonate transport system ATP-binding protein